MRVWKINLNEIDAKYKDIEEIKVIVLADIHLGSEKLDKKLLKKAINYIKDNDDVFCVLNGDLMDVAIKNSVSDCYTAEYTVDEQIDKLVEILTPIKNKILCATTGNHEDRIKKETGVDITKRAMAELGIKDKYTNNAWYLFLRFGEKKQGRKCPMVYTIHGYHGGSSGISEGAKINKLVAMGRTVIADVHVMSHVHTPLTTSKVINLPDYANNTINVKKISFGTNGAFLKNGGYGEKKGYEPLSNEGLQIILNGKIRDANTEKIDFMKF